MVEGDALRRTQTYAPFTTATQGGLLTAIDVGTQADPDFLLHLGYTYDVFGNVTTLTEATTGNPLTYDGQSRVTAAFGRYFSYQPSGRFDRFVGLTFAYTDTLHIHAVTSTGAGGAFAYDAAGNMTRRRTTSTAPVQTLAWSGANELLSVTAGATVESYRYDEEGQRIYQESKTGGNLTWQHFDYFPHYSVKVVGGVTTATKYYFFNGQRIAQRVGDTLTYLHADHLGSTVLTTGVSGNQQYHAYGATRSGLVKTEHQFTGHETDGTGLIYMQARYYDPVIGQFISPDTIVPDPTNVYAYNRYMYTYGNPVKYSDPGGHDPLDAAWQEEFRRIHGRDPDPEDVTIRLYSLAFPDEWDWTAFYDSTGMLVPGSLDGVLGDAGAREFGRSWAGMASSLQSLAGWYTESECEMYTRDVGTLFAGLLNRIEQQNAWDAVSFAGNPARQWVYLLPEGLPQSLVGSNSDANVHHWGWGVVLGGSRFHSFGEAINTSREFSQLRVDELISPPEDFYADVALGNAGVVFGRRIRFSGVRDIAAAFQEPIDYWGNYFH